MSQKAEMRKILALSDNHSTTKISNTCLEKLKSFQRKYPDVSLDTFRYETSGDTILHCSARQGNFLTCSYLLRYFHPDCRNKDNKTPLHEAAQFGRSDIVELLIKCKADVNALKKADWTPLMLACTKLTTTEAASKEAGGIVENENYKIVDLLLTNGAVVNFQNKDGWSALHLAAREGDLHIATLLCDHGANPRLRTKNGNTILHIAALHKNAKLFNYLYSSNNSVIKSPSILKTEEILMQGNHGNYPLHEAVLSKNLEMFRLVASLTLKMLKSLQTPMEVLLTDQETKLEQLTNKVDYNMLHLAVFIGCMDIVNACVNEYGFDVHQKTKDSQTMLHISVMGAGSDEVYQKLLNLGVDDGIVDKFGRRPGDYNLIQNKH